MSIPARADQLRDDVLQYLKREAARLMVSNWQGQVASRQKAMAQLQLSRKRFGELIDGALVPLDGGSETGEAQEAFAGMQLDMAASLLKEKGGFENRNAKLAEFLATIKAQRDSFNQQLIKGAASVSQMVKDFVAKAKSVSGFLVDLAKDPLKYARLALDFANGEVDAFLIKYLSKTFGWGARKISNALGKSIPTSEEISAYAAYLWSEKFKDISEFPRIARVLEKALWLLKGALVGVQVVTTFFSELATRGSWANAVAKGAVMGSFTAATIMTSAWLEGVVLSTLQGAAAFASATAEVPPLAAVIVAAGIVIVAGIALAAVFDKLVECCFGRFSISPAMRLPMSISTVGEMSSSMTLPMKSSMLPD